MSRESKLLQIVADIDEEIQYRKNSICQVCGKRHGTLTQARYRLESETTEDWGRNAEILKEVRPLRICGFCVHKVENGVENGMSNGRITIEEIIWENGIK